MTAIPIVSLIAFLISVIIAYLGAQQLSRFGATIFVVDLVTISVLREMGVMLTAIIVAGRSGSAFAAEIGVMQLNEETDALRAMGMNPIEVLVVPRILALAIALPLLTVIADAMGLAGGCLLCLVQLHIPLPQFISRLHESLAPTTFWSGLIKAPVFAVLIGMVGAYRGMQVRESARELGRLTTMRWCRRSPGHPRGCHLRGSVRADRLLMTPAGDRPGHPRAGPRQPVRHPGGSRGTSTWRSRQ